MALTITHAATAPADDGSHNTNAAEWNAAHTLAGTIDSAQITDGTIVNADINAAAAISADKTADGTTNKAFLATERTKLAGVATGATANDTDANLKARANHTGTQLAVTISDFNAAVRLNRLDQMAAPTASVAMGSQKLTGLLDPTADQEAATKKYVDDNIGAGGTTPASYASSLAGELITGDVAWFDMPEAMSLTAVTRNLAVANTGVSLVLTYYKNDVSVYAVTWTAGTTGAGSGVGTLPIAFAQDDEFTATLTGSNGARDLKFGFRGVTT